MKTSPIDSVTDLILTATLQVKASIDQVVPLLKMGADQDPKFKGVYEAYENIQENLGKAIKELKEMK